MTHPASELAHPIQLERIGAASIKVSLAPDSTVRSALADRFDLLSLDALAAELTVRRQRATGWIEVSGTVSGRVVQSCVATNDPVPATVSADVLELFDDSGEIGPDEVDLDPMADTPEPIAGGVLDVGEIAAQAFGLALDPYPRAVGGTAEAVETGKDDDRTSVSPFAKLAVLKDPDVKKR
ncbi:DUF177 domain-containing protein [Thalassobaculum sp.]|uniref:YceD family protein n=1 Tax=Thalassobaculum sp. TaxID=2022740 RepID=UPI0032EFDCCC